MMSYISWWSLHIVGVGGVWAALMVFLWAYISIGKELIGPTFLATLVALHFTPVSN